MNPRIILATAAALLLIAAPAQAKRAAGELTYQMTNDGHWGYQGATEARSSPRKPHRRVSKAPSNPPEAATKAPKAQSTSNVIRSKKTGATAHVSLRFVATAQAIIDDLEQNHGAIVRFIGGWRRGSCSLASQHPCGDAIDVCQTSRGSVDPRCNLPAPSVFHQVALAHGAYEGSTWCSSDYGHVQRRYSGGCSVAAHGRGARQLATITGKMVDISARKASEHAHRVRHSYRRHYAKS